MKRNNKRFLKVLSICAVACFIVAISVFAITSCGKKPTPSGGSESKQESIETESVILPDISFSVSEKSLTVGDEEYLIPNYTKTEGFVLTYSSSDSSIVNVNNNGKISALKEGTATVTATYAKGEHKAQASIVINSSFSGYLPELNAKGVAEGVAIVLGETYQILSYVSFNGKTFNDGEVTYRSLDENVVTVNENGEVLAKNKGSTEIIIEGSWRGKDKNNTPTMQKTIEISVIDNVKFYNANSPIMDEVIYTLSEFDGVTYQNSIPYAFEVIVNGNKENATVTIENEDIVRIEGDKLVANAFGYTKVLVQKVVGENAYSKTFTITVNRVEKVVGDTVPLFSTVDGTYLDFGKNKKHEILDFVNDGDQVVDAYQGSKALKVDGGKILGVSSSSESKRGTAEISVGTDKVIYYFTLESLAKALSQKEDLKSLELVDGKAINGYFELLCDIDAAGVTLDHVATNNACFSGVFNGNGFVIKNLELKANSSLFGVLSSTAIIKNFALVNLNATKAYFLAQNTLNDGLTISDVYIELSPSTATPRGITGRTGSSSIYNNVVIEYLGENAEKGRDYSERWTWQGLVGGMWTYEKDGKLYAQDTKWSNVYVISPYIVSFRSDDKKFEGVEAAVYGYGVNESVDVYGNSLDTAVSYRDNPNLGDYWWTTAYYNASYTNLYHYNSYEELKSQARDFTAFDNDYWVVIGSRVVWKGLFTNDLQIKLYDGLTDLGESHKIVGLDTELKVKPYYDGVELRDFEVNVEDNDYVIWNSGNKVLKLIKLPTEGFETVKVNLTISVNGKTVEKSFVLSAVGEIIEISTVYDYISEEDGKMAGNPFPMEEIIGEETLISIYQGATELVYNKEDGTLIGLTANIEGIGEERVVKPVELTINTKGKVYIVNVMVYTKVINTASDLKFLSQSLAENANVSYGGYYILTNNIVDYSITYNDVADSNNGLKAFTGTFDGNGHSVSLKVNKGVFGVLGHGAVIKNMAFTNMQVTVSDAYQQTAIISSGIANETDEVVIKDVYVSVDEESSYRQYLSKWFTTAMLVSNNASLKSKFSNIIIEADILHSDYNSKGGAEPCLFRYWNGINNSTVGGEYATGTVIDSLTNVYVISKDRTNMGGLFRVTANIGKDVNASTALSYNDYTVIANFADAYTTIYLPNDYMIGENTFVTMRRYDDYAAMASDNNDYSLFNSQCWDLTGQTPVWKNK